MKKIIFIAFVAILSVTTYAQGVGMKFSSGTLNELRAEATSAKKLIFVDVYTTWCGPCKVMAADIFPQPVVGNYMNATFVNAKFDAEKGEGIEIAAKYEVKAYPTMLILDAQGKEVGRIVGSSPTPEAFVKRIKDTLPK